MSKVAVAAIIKVGSVFVPPGLIASMPGPKTKGGYPSPNLAGTLHPLVPCGPAKSFAG